MNIKTKSGFSCKVNEARAKDWRFAKGLADCDSGDESRILKGMTFVVPFLLGEKGEEALIKHVTNKNGIAPTDLIMSEFKEILSLMGEETKKSLSSQE